MGDLGERLRLLVIEGRAKQRLSQADFAKKVGVSADTIGKWEAGKVPEAANLPALAEALGMSTDQLLTGEEPFFERVVGEVLRRLAEARPPEGRG